MIKQGIFVAAILLLTSIVLTNTATAQGMRLEKAVISAGGGMTANADMTMHYTVGQPLVGTVSNGTHTAMLGFWSSAAQQPSSAPIFQGDGQIVMTVSPHPISAEGADIILSVARSGMVRVTLYDALGNTVGTLYEGKHAGGEIRLRINGEALASGTYYIAATGPGVLIQKPIVVMN